MALTGRVRCADQHAKRSAQRTLHAPAAGLTPLAAPNVAGPGTASDRQTDRPVHLRAAVPGRCRSVLREAVTSLGLPPGSSVLHLGCDYGELCLENDETYDCIVAAGVIERVRWDRLFVRKLFSLLRPGGYLIISVPNQYCLADRINAYPLHLWRKAVGRFAAGRVSSDLLPGTRVDCGGPGSTARSRVLTGHEQRRVRSADQERGNSSALHRDPHSGPYASSGLHDGPHSGPYALRCTGRRYAPGEIDHLLNKVGFDILYADSYGLGPVKVVGLPLPHALTAAIDWGLERVRRSTPGAFLKDRGRDLVVTAQKPTHAGIAARLDATPTLDRAIERFEASYKSEFDRLASWERVCGSGWASLEGDVMSGALKRCESAVVLSPHPDDELIGCGGVMLELIDRGARLAVIQMTDGAGSEALRDADEHTRRTIRIKEARCVAEAMGVTQLTFLDARNGQLDESNAHVEAVRRVLEDSSPDIVFVPFINDRHPDHVAANLVLKAALTGLGDGCRPLILAYEVWSLVPRHWAHSIDAFVQRKLDLLMSYPTPMSVVDYIWHCQVRDGHHSRHYLHRDGYAEAYLALQRETFEQLIVAHRETPAPANGPGAIEKLICGLDSVMLSAAKHPDAVRGGGDSSLRSE